MPINTRSKMVCLKHKIRKKQADNTIYKNGMPETKDLKWYAGNTRSENGMWETQDLKMVSRKHKI